MKYLIIHPQGYGYVYSKECNCISASSDEVLHLIRDLDYKIILIPISVSSVWVSGCVCESKLRTPYGELQMYELYSKFQEYVRKSRPTYISSSRFIYLPSYPRKNIIRCGNKDNFNIWLKPLVPTPDNILNGVQCIEDMCI